MQRHLTTILILLATVTTVRAQSITYPDPVLYAIYPAGAQRGTTITAEFHGTNGFGKNGRYLRILVDGPPGITVGKVTLVNSGLVKAELTVAADAPVGRRRLRVAGGANGLTNFREFFVGTITEVFELEPNNAPDKAQSVESPQVINGRIGRTLDIDCFRFHAKAGQKFVAAVTAHQMDAFYNGTARERGYLDTRLEVTDTQGNVVATADDSTGLDPLVTFTPKSDADYVVRIQSLKYKGSPRAVYRLTLGSVAWPTAVFPPGGRRGETVEVELIGPNVPTGTKCKVAVAEDPRSPLQRYVHAESGADLPLLRGDFAEVVEKEPNESASQSQPLSVPVTANGRFLKAGDEDWYRLALKKAESVLLQTTAQRFLRSPVDTAIEVYDSTGRKVAGNDDGLLFRGQAHGDYPSTDSRLTFIPRTDGEYHVRVRNLAGTHGPAAVYRLTVQPLKPDFVLFQWPDAVPIWGAGTTSAFVVHAQHWGGLTCDLQLRIEGLPKGWTGSTTNVPMGRFRNMGARGNLDTYLLTITAPADAKPGDTAPFRVVGRGVQDGRVIEHVAQTQTLLGPSHSDRMHLRVSHTSRAVIAQDQDSWLETTAKNITVKSGGQVEIPVTVHRRPAKTGVKPPQISLVLDGPPGGARTGWSSPVQLNADEIEKRVVLKTANRPPGTYGLVISRGWIGDIRGGRPGPCTPVIKVTIQPAETSARP